MATNSRLAWEIQWVKDRGYPLEETQRLITNLELVYLIRLLQAQMKRYEAMGSKAHIGTELYTLNHIRIARERISANGYIEYTTMPANTPRQHFSLYQTLIRK